MLNTYNMTLFDTIPYMSSKDYKERFIGEYWQTKIRYNNLHNMLVKYEADTLDFEPSCSLDLLQEQAKYMGMYLNKLEIRASIEEIDLEQPFKVKTKENASVSLGGENNPHYTIEELDKMTTSTHTDGWVDTSEMEWGEDEEVDFTFEEMCKFFEVNQKVVHETYGIGRIKGIWYDIEKENPSLTMEIKWDNGAKCMLDSTVPYHVQVMSELILG